MSAFESYLKSLVKGNQLTFSKYPELKWLNAYTAQKSEELRSKSYQRLKSSLRWSFKNTKPWLNRLSPGCQLCGEGKWSCLFITGKCNAHCFYCPASQLNDEKPQTQLLTFETPEDYAAYLNYFGFKGCSFSGGEPLLYFDRLLYYLKTVRQQCSPDLYIWAYTNGILASEEKFTKLAENGLNEIRFDIGATNYSLTNVRKAKGIIPRITIEIPAVPEKCKLIKTLIPEMIEAGVTSLNLHLLRLTTHNVEKLQDHPYTYVHGEAPVVMESELAALEIMQYVAENKFDIGVNFCAFQFKNRFQKAGYRKMVTQKLFPNALVTENGFVRELFVKTTNNDTFKLMDESDFIRNFQPFEEVKIVFKGIQIKNTSQNKTHSFTIENTNYVLEESLAAEPLIIHKNLFEPLVSTLQNSTNTPPEDDDLFAVWRFSSIESGFREWF